jgi:hypothetical protein
VLDRVDDEELAVIQERQDALGAQRLVHDMLLGDVVEAG